MQQILKQQQSMVSESQRKQGFFSKQFDKLRIAKKKISAPGVSGRFQKKARLQSFLNISVKQNLATTSEIGWINKTHLVLTLNNAYYLINLLQRDMIRVRNSIQYGKQQVNMNLFCSITRKYTASDEKHVHQDRLTNEAKLSSKISNQLIES